MSPQESPFQNPLWWSAFALAFLSGIGSIPWLRSWALKRNFTDPVDASRKIHTHPTPRIGGIALFFPFALCVVSYSIWGNAVLVQEALWKEWFCLAGGSLAMFGIGLFDDFKPLGAKWKLTAQTVVCGFTACFGFQMHALTNPLTGAAWSLGVLEIPFTFFWLLAVTNLINLIDGIDGLAAGVCLFVFSVLTVTIGFLGGGVLLFVCAVLMGSLLAFLYFNFPPAKIFMGDGGAYFLGFLIAQVGLAAGHKSTIAATLLVPLLALGLPIIDTTLAILRRGVRGLPLFRADREHVHHQLLSMGYSPKRVVVLLYVVCALFSLGGMVVFLNQGKGYLLALGFLFTMAIGALWVLGYVRGNDPWVYFFSALTRRAHTVRLVSGMDELSSFGARAERQSEIWALFCEWLEEARFDYAWFDSACSRLDSCRHESHQPPLDYESEFDLIDGKTLIGRLTLGALGRGREPRFLDRKAHLLRDGLRSALASYLKTEKIKHTD